MAHTYLLELYERIDARRQESKAALESAKTPAAKARQAGRLEVLDALERFLARRYNRKLPRRLWRRYPPA